MRIDVKDIEIAHLTLSYAHTRIRDLLSERRLCVSLESHGQLTPVVVVPQKPLGYVLLDGYLRVAALKRLGRDMVKAEIHEREQETLIQVMCRTQARRWEIFEQAKLIKEAMIRFDYNQADMARFLGKSESFISRRLLALESLDEEMCDHVQQGRVSIWSATRILAPLARANAGHARQLIRRIMAHPFTTRELMTWFDTYRKANKKHRSIMVENPRMVLNALRVTTETHEGDSIRSGPEGRWENDMNIVAQMLKRLTKDVDMVFFDNQSVPDRRLLLAVFEETVKKFNELIKKIRRINVTCPNTGDYPATACPGGSYPENQSSFEPLPQGGPARPEQRPAG